MWSCRQQASLKGALKIDIGTLILNYKDLFSFSVVVKYYSTGINRMQLYDSIIGDIQLVRRFGKEITLLRSKQVA